MSSIPTLLDTCLIPSNPDIAGIGVRIAIYVQNLLTFIPALWAIWDLEVSDYELEGMEAQSTTNLILAFALLVSCFVQGSAAGGSGALTNYHASIVLSMSWTNNTNAFVYFLLYVHYKGKAGPGRNAVEPRWAAWVDHIRNLFWAFIRPFSGPNSEPRPEGVPLHEGNLAHQGSRNRKRSAAKILFRRVALLLGSLHLTVMAALGLWLWSDPSTFGSRASSCVLESAEVAVLGVSVPFSSGPLRIFSLVIYALFLVPGVNLLLPMAAFLSLFLWHHSQRRQLESSIPTVSQTTLPSPPHPLSHRGITNHLKRTYTRCIHSPIFPVLTGLSILLLINVVLIVDIELTLHRNRSLQEPGEAEWGFGQVLAVLLLFMPLRDLLEMVLARRQRRQEMQIREHEWREAVHLGDVERIFGLVKAGVNPNVGTGDGRTALEVVTLAGNWARVCDIVKAGANVNVPFQDASYGTVLQAACATGPEDVVDLLLKRGADPTAKGGKHGETCLHTACIHNKKEIVHTFLERDVDPNLTGQPLYYNPPQSMCKDGHLHLDDRGRTPLHAASIGEFVDVARYLIDSNADPNIRTTKGETPLHSACWEKSAEFSKVLLEFGADPNLRSREKGFTPLHIACWRRSTETVRYLVESGADVNIRDNKGETPLQLVRRLRPTKDLDIVELLRQHGAAE